MFKLLDGCGKEYEEIDKYNFSSFRKDHEITEKNALLMDDCTICSNLLDVERMNIIKLKPDPLKIVELIDRFHNLSIREGELRYHYLIFSFNFYLFIIYIILV